MTAPRLIVSPGPRNARTDPATGLRFYRWKGREVPSVTSLRRLAGLPHPLHEWMVKRVVEHAVENAASIAERVATGDARELRAVRQELRGAGGAQRDQAADLGTAVHEACTSGKTPDQVPPQVRPRVRQFRAWLATSGAEVVTVERQIWNLTLGYAGSFDLLVRLRDGTLWLVDIKTGKSSYPEHALQLIAYSMAEFVGEDDVVDEKTSTLLHAVKGMALLHLSDTGWEFIAVRHDRRTWAAFRGLLSFATWLHENTDMTKVTAASRAGREDAA